MPTVTGTKPAPRSGPAAVFDPGSNRMIVFGGALGFASPCANDLWVLSNANGVGGAPAWTQLTTSGGPPSPRTRLAAVYDQATNTMIIHGGNNCFSTENSDVWILTNANGLTGTPTWTQLPPTGTAPSGREDNAAVYDSANNRMIIYGGATTSTDDPSAWVLTNANGAGGTPAWIQLSPSGTIPPARATNTDVYDAAHNIMTVFGGQDGSGNILNDTWYLLAPTE